MTSAEQVLDMELIAQRVLALAEIATLEHVDMLLASQARAMVEAPGDSGGQPPAASAA